MNLEKMNSFMVMMRMIVMMMVRIIMMIMMIIIMMIMMIMMMMMVCKQGQAWAQPGSGCHCHV